MVHGTTAVHGCSAPAIALRPWAAGYSHIRMWEYSMTDRPKDTIDEFNEFWRAGTSALYPAAGIYAEGQ
eukprot:COSAG01_NODE_4473_length_4989_cov_3.564826_2_plen_69_part_00